MNNLKAIKLAVAALMLALSVAASALPGRAQDEQEQGGQGRPEAAESC